MAENHMPIPEAPDRSRGDIALAELYKSRAEVVHRQLQLTPSWTEYAEYKKSCEALLAGVDAAIARHLASYPTI